MTEENVYPETPVEAPEAIPPESGAIYYYVARYGILGTVETFTSTIEDLRSGESAVGKTERGVECVEVLSKFDDASRLPTNTPFPRILRRLTREDEVELERIATMCVPMELNFCREKIAKLGLQMKLTLVEHLLGSDRIAFYFLAEGRVDFRELVRELAREFQTRIELKQIGVRDEARMLSDYEHCGRELCCRSYMKKLQPVGMKMAKNQKATLDPSKISGACGRLMCCLRYEDRVYTELLKTIPKKGSFVETKGASGRVADSDVLGQRVTLEPERGPRVVVSVSEITSVLPKGQMPVGPRSEGPATPGGGAGGSAQAPSGAGAAGQLRDGERGAEASRPGPVQGAPAQREGGAPDRPAKRKRRRRRGRGGARGNALPGGEGRADREAKGEGSSQEGKEP
ncbi:MAG: regulatory iron-sulfur-containing complex subunit RicT [Planctomycetota bacterium]